jgi:hypothetical protein
MSRPLDAIVDATKRSAPGTSIAGALHMHSRVLFFALLGLQCACHASQIDARAASDLADARTSAERSIAYATCADGHAFGPNCGLILRISASDDFRVRFREKVCLEKTSEACEEAFGRLIDAELARRYFAADRAGVAQSCDLHPGFCDDGVAYEKLLMNSHNARIQAQYDGDADRIEAERTRAHHVDNAAALAAVGGALDTVTALSGGTVCHSSPSVFGGEVTVCSR